MKRLTAFSGVIAIALTIVAFFQPSFLFGAGGFWALFIVLLPTALAPTPPRLFSIWSFVILTIAIGLAARGIYISLNLPDFFEIDRLYLLGRGPAFFVKPLFILLLGLATFTVGYSSAKRSPAFHLDHEWDPQRAILLGKIILVISIASFLLYARFTDGFSFESLSAKRTPIPGIDLEGQNFKSYGILRHLSLLAVFAHLIVLAQAIQSGKRSDYILAAALLLAACLQPFYASVRTVVASNFIFSAAVFYFLSGKKFPIKFITFGAAVALLITAMTILRSGDSEKGVVESIVLNRNQIELPKTAHIINSVPEVLDYQYGKTLLRWFAAPIPREFWPDKPIIHPGPVIGNYIYGQKVGGVPPGLIGELWWNFSWFGIVLGGFGCGIGLGWVENRFSPKANPNPTAVVIYIAGPMLIGYEMLGSSIGSGIFRTISGLFVSFFLLWLVKRR